MMSGPRLSGKPGLTSASHLPAWSTHGAYVLSQLVLAVHQQDAQPHMPFYPGFPQYPLL